MDRQLFDSLVKEGKYAEAKALLKQDLAEGVTPEEEGEAYVQMIMDYLEASNAINEAYISELKEIEAAMKDVDNIELKGKNNIQLGGIRDQIKDL